MTDGWAEIVRLQVIESQLRSTHGPLKIAAIRPAFHVGIEVEDIALIAELPVWRVRQAILGEATKRESDD
jgi:hypothetical protein